MDHQDGTDLAALHQAIATASAAAFPGVHFEFYREDREKLPTMGGPGQPTACCLLDLVEMDPGEADAGTEQVDVMARFEAAMVVSFRTPSAKVAIRALAANYAAYLRKKLRWPGVVNGKIQGIQCFKDDFRPELDQYEVWTVQWAQVLRFGTGVWKNEGTTPARIFASFVPDIGGANEAAYVELEAASELAQS